MAEELPGVVKSILNEKQPGDIAIEVKYKNHRGEIGNRRIIPLNIFHGRTEYHPQYQWLLKVWDVDKKDYRTYALKDIEEWKN